MHSPLWLCWYAILQDGFAIVFGGIFLLHLFSPPPSTICLIPQIILQETS